MCGFYYCSLLEVNVFDFVASKWGAFFSTASADFPTTSENVGYVLVDEDYDDFSSHSSLVVVGIMVGLAIEYTGITNQITITPFVRKSCVSPRYDVLKP
jgi:hypothetical protein